MNVLYVSSRPYDHPPMEAANHGRFTLHFSEVTLTRETTSVAAGYPVICGFVNDRFDAEVLRSLAAGGTRLITLRCTGFNNVDLEAARELGIHVARVTSYSPYSVAEFVIGLLQALNRKVHKAYIRAREEYFLLDGLLGFDLHGKTVGIYGTGKIGTVLARILTGFGCRLLGHDPFPNEECRSLGLKYVSQTELLQESDIISLHAPLTPQTHHVIDREALDLVKPGVYLINTSRGALVDSRALIDALKSGRVGAAGLDVYEEEESIFFRDLTGTIQSDDVFARLLTFPNVIITGHQAYFTNEALRDIAEATLQNIADFAASRSNENWLTERT
ncbi:MAG: 2-hydroxyacid dehydrogenase [Puniceicoccaceae bacterium]